MHASALSGANEIFIYRLVSNANWECTVCESYHVVHTYWNCYCIVCIVAKTFYIKEGVLHYHCFNVGTKKVVCTLDLDAKLSVHLKLINLTFQFYLWFYRNNSHCKLFLLFSYILSLEFVWVKYSIYVSEEKEIILFTLNAIRQSTSTGYACMSICDVH